MQVYNYADHKVIDYRVYKIHIQYEEDEWGDPKEQQNIFNHQQAWPYDAGNKHQVHQSYTIIDRGIL